MQQDTGCRERIKQKHEKQKRLSGLTNRELVVLKLLVKNADVPSSKEIAHVLDISHRTVEQHRSRILEKIGVSSVWELRADLDAFDLFS